MNTPAQYKKEDLVWAKVEGYNWWPAIVAAVDKPENTDDALVTVNFIGESSHASLPTNKVVRFREKFGVFSKTQKKLLMGAIETAKKIESGEIKYVCTVLRTITQNHFGS